MKKTAKWIILTTTFLLCGLLIFGKVSQLFRVKTGNAADMMHTFYDLDRDSIDVLALGSSHGYWAVQSNYLWKEYGITSYVMCSPRQSVATSYYALKEALRYQSPSVVLLESYYFYFDGKYSDKPSQPWVRRAFDGLRMDSVKWEMVEDFFGDLSFSEKMTYYLPFLQYHSRWTELTDTDFHTYPYLRGSSLGFTIFEMSDPGVPEQASEIPEIDCEYLERMKALCDENGIQLVVYAAPYGYDPDSESYQQYARKQGVNVALESYLEEQDIPFLFYQKMEDVTFDYAADFRNSTHLNTNGGFRLSGHLGKWLQETYGIADHRGDKAYSSFDEDYAKYQNLLDNYTDDSNLAEE